MNPVAVIIAIAAIIVLGLGVTVFLRRKNR